MSYANEEIEVKANEIIKKYGLTEPGFDLTNLLTEKEDFLIGEQEMDAGTTGLLLVNDNDHIPNTETHRLIAVNRSLGQDENKQRRRFIVAHEYGHFILHKRNASLFAHRSTEEKDSVIELEADYFARCLLMPKEWVDAVLEELKPLTIDEKILIIAHRFNVTKNKARKRLCEDFGLS